MAKAFKKGDCVRLPDGRIGRVRGVSGGSYRVRVRRTTSATHQFLLFAAEELLRRRPSSAEGGALANRLPWPDLVIYELIIDDFTREYRGGLTPIDAVVGKLDYLQGLGVNAVGFMPWIAWLVLCRLRYATKLRY